MSQFHSGTDRERITDILKHKEAHIHFTGFCGAGMYPLYKLTQSLGFCVSGSDSGKSRYFKESEKNNEEVFAFHKKENAEGADLLVYSLAVAEDNPELTFAKETGIPAVSRAEYLGAIMQGFKRRIGVSGTHGKSTTTAMLDSIFGYAGKNPTTVIGASLSDNALPYRIGGTDTLIYEACEYKDSFLHFSPTLAVFLNLEHDHVDYFSDIEAVKKSFLAAVNSATHSIVNYDDAALKEIIGLADCHITTFGMSEEADYRVEIISSKKGKYKLKFTSRKNHLFEICLSVPGHHNVLNACAAVAAAIECGIPHDAVKAALSDFSGIERRLQYLCTYNGARVYYDYAHHPTEISCAIKTVKEIEEGNVTVIFKPHTYSRTAGLMIELAESLSLAENVFLSEISAIREDKLPGVTSEVLASHIGPSAECIDDENILIALNSVQSDAIIIMGAANLDNIKEIIIQNGGR